MKNLEKAHRLPAGLTMAAQFAHIAGPAGVCGAGSSGRALSPRHTARSVP